MAHTLQIPGRFNGPPGSANGGYTCGLVAGELDGRGGAEVALRAPPPLERELRVDRDEDGVRLLDGGTLVASGHPVELELDTPDPVGLEEAEHASREHEAAWAAPHPFPTCVVCGPEREPGDGFRVFPGPASEGRWAATWTPEADDPVLVWAALDCPTSAPVANFGDGPAMVLGTLAARLERAPSPGRPHVLTSWPLGADGRKRFAGAALFDEEGGRLAFARATWIELRS